MHNGFNLPDKTNQPINSKPITISWKGFRSEGKTQYTRLTGMKEIINNVVVDDYHGTKINVQIVIDSSRKLLIITDDFEGFKEPQVRLPGAMNLGQSYQTSAILSEHGRGLKTAINYFGDIQVIRTSSDTYDFYELIPDRTQDDASFYVQKSQPIETYSIDNNGWIPVKNKTGTQIALRMDDSQLPGNKRWWDNLKKGLEASYNQKINNVLDIQLIWLEDDKVKYHAFCEKQSMVLTDRQACLDENNPTKWIDQDRKLGPDRWEHENKYFNHDDWMKENNINGRRTGIVVKYTIGTLPSPEVMDNHFNSAQVFENSYDINSDSYKETPFRYGSDYTGLSYSKEWIPISFGGFKEERSNRYDLFGYIDIQNNSIPTTKTKDDIVRTEDVILFEKHFKKHLREELGYNVSTSKNNPPESESQMESKLMKRLTKSSKLRKYLGIKTNEFDNQYQLHCGVLDIVPILHKDNVVIPVEKILEIKLENTEGRIWKAVVQGMAYGAELNIFDIIIVSLDTDWPSDLKTKVDMIEKHTDFTFRFEQYQKLMEI